MIKRVLLSLILLFVLFKVNSFAQNSICASPGSDGTQMLSTLANTFCPSPTGKFMLPAGSIPLILGLVPDPFAVGSIAYNFGATPISADSGSEYNLNSGSGYIGTAAADRYGYVIALKVVTAAGGMLRLQSTGSKGPLSSYRT